MENPFLKRAAEFLRDPEAFLAIVSPEPARSFLTPHATSGTLYERLIHIRGTPGSGKTTLARLFSYPVLTTLLKNRDLSTYGSVFATLVECGAIVEDRPAVLTCRLPMESDYRTIWEFPYDDELKHRLTIALLQSRAVLGWTRALRESGVSLDRIRIAPRSDAAASVAAIGADSPSNLVNRARLIEELIYRLVGALVTPPIESVTAELREAYHPFDVIEGIIITDSDAAGQLAERNLRPLVILDDAHVLHPVQLQRLQAWLARREVRVSRWVLSRIDVMHPKETFAVVSAPESSPALPGITSGRDTHDILLQSAGREKAKYRTRFREIARDISSRYMRRMPVFNSRNLESLADLLETLPEPISPAKLQKLQSELLSIQRKFNVSDKRLGELTGIIDSYRPQAGEIEEDVRAASLRILLHRYLKRIPQQGLFDDERGDPEPSRPLRVDASVLDAARLQLLHEFDRPFFFGMDALCDCGSENTEQFLHLAAHLVEAITTRVIRGSRPSLDARTQHRLLTEKATDIMQKWDFPQRQSVVQIVDRIAARCIEESLSPNAWIGAGANAYGIPQDEFESLPESHPSLAHVLHFGIAYNALSLNPRYPCKNRDWCLIELGGVPILRFGLTLKRGGFIEGTAGELARMVMRND